MSYPLIILGAGASHDYMDRRNYYREDRFKPPLLNDLFEDRFSSFMDDYPEVADLAAHAAGVSNFEEYLTNVQEVLAKTNKERYKQLIALRFYLSKLFLWVSENYYHKMNYYRRLITTIKDSTQDARACFVNFNYDLLLEKNISEIDTTDIKSYISGNIKVIKIHGAYNWLYLIEDMINDKKIPAYKHFIMFADTFVTNYINKERSDKKLMAEKIDLGWGFQRINNDSGQVFRFLPALAVPLATKNSYVCPNEHITHLDSAIASTDRILILGWRGNDQFLIKKLTKDIQRAVKVTIVSKNSSDALKKKLSVNNNLEINALPLGFSEFMWGEEVNKFFS